jgi:hypothetical protein
MSELSGGMDGGVPVPAADVVSPDEAAAPVTSSPGPSYPPPVVANDASARRAPTGGDIGRGLALALLVVPVGVVLWVLLWEGGVVASLVSLLVAYGATYLYRVGSRRTRVVRASVWGIIGIVFLTLVLSVLSGLAVDLAKAGQVDVFTALGLPGFWDAYGRLLGNGAMWSQLSTTLIVAVLLAALGCFGTTRRLLRESATTPTGTETTR